jgi:hypothetical protein
MTNVLINATLRRPVNAASQPQACVGCRQKTGELLRCPDLQIGWDDGVRNRAATPTVEWREDRDC